MKSIQFKDGLPYKAYEYDSANFYEVTYPAGVSVLVYDPVTEDSILYLHSDTGFIITEVTPKKEELTIDMLRVENERLKRNLMVVTQRLDKAEHDLKDRSNP